MKYLLIDAIKDGMYLAKDVFTNDGKVLLVRGTKLTKMYLQRLKDFNYTHLYVREEIEDENENADLEIVGPVNEATRVQANKIVKDTLAKIFICPDPDLKQINLLADIILDEILTNTDVIYNMLELKKHDDYTYSHSVNICIISTIMGKFMGYPRERLKKLVVGTLLHDLGKVYIDKAILDKNSCLTQEETFQVQEHTKLGFERLRAYSGLSILSAHVAYQHHEREDGSGYPRRLKGHEIHPFAKIAAVADSYDAMTSNRPYRKPLFSHEAIVELKNNSPLKYDLKAVTALTWAVAPYPIGSVVLLNTREKSIVVNANRKKIIVQILSGRRKKEFVEIKKDTEVQIEKRLS